MMRLLLKPPKTPTPLLLRLRRRGHCTAAETTNPITPVDQSHLLRVCTILYQQQNSPEQKLHTNLIKANFHLTHEFFLQVCNKFPLSWKPVHKLHIFSQTQPHFHHTPTTFNKMLDVVGKSRNIDLLWHLLQESGKLRLVNIKTFLIGLKMLSSARELKKCVEFFDIMNGFGYVYSVETLNAVVEALCKGKLVGEAKHVVLKLKGCGSVKPDGVIYKWLVYGFCDIGDLVEASKVWNLMVEEGFVPDIGAVETMVETLFKTNQYGDALKLFQEVRVKRMDDLGLSTYKLVIKWLCKKGKLGESFVLFEEMQSKGIKGNDDNELMASLVFGLVSKGRIREAYKAVEEMEKHI